MRVCDPYEKQIPSHREKAKNGAKRRVSVRSFAHVDRRESRKARQTRRRFCSSRLPFFPAHTHTLHPPNTMSAFLAGSPVVAKVAAKPVAKRNVTVRAAAPSEYVPRLPSRSFILLARTLSHAAEPRNVATRRRASWLTFDAPLRPIPPRVINNSGVTRRAAVAGVLAFFVAQPVRPLPDRVSSDILLPRPPSRRERVFPPPRLTVPLHLCVVPVLTAQASAETKRVRAKEAVEAYSPYAGSMSKSAGSGFGKYKAPRAFLKDEQAAVMKAYGLERLPGQ